MPQIDYLPKSVPLDSGANLLAGAKRYYYVTLTSTPKDTYTDYALTTPHANPVVADGSGVFPTIFLKRDALYRMTLKTSADVLIYTQDDIGGPFATQAEIGLIFYPQTAAEIAAGVTPTNYAYAPGDLRRYGTNTTPGTTDMTTTLTNALASNTVINLPDESILISSTISVTDNKTIEGQGSNKTIITTSVNTFSAFTITSNARRVQIRNLGITSGAGVGASNAAISIHTTGGCAQSTFEHLRISSFFTGILYGDLFWDSTVRDVRCDSCTRGAYSAGVAGTAIEVLWDRFYSESHTTVGWRCGSVKNYTLLNCNFGGASAAQAVVIAASGASYVKIISCNFELHTVASGTGVVELSSGATANFDQCTWVSNAGASGTAYQLRLINSAIAYVTNCREVTNGANISSVTVANTATLYKFDDGLPTVTHASGSTAATIVYSPYQPRQALSDQITLSAAAVSKTIYVPKRAGRVTRVAAIYPIATSADAGVTITVKSDDAVFTYASFTSHASQAAFDVQEIALSSTAFTATRPIIVASAGGKTGLGDIVIVLEWTED